VVLLRVIAASPDSPRFPLLAMFQDLDAGQFVYSAAGQRWIADLGPDNYALPGYFGPLEGRYQYYRKNSHGHNVLSFDG
jgi:hypothetical protein